MRDGGDGKPGRERARRDALSSARFMLRVWAGTYMVAKLVCYLAPTAYVEATFGDALYFECDVAHRFENAGGGTCSYYLVINSQLT